MYICPLSSAASGPRICDEVIFLKLSMMIRVKKATPQFSCLFMKNQEQGIFLALSWVRTNRYDQRVLCNKMDRTKSPTLFELMFFISTSFGHTGSDIWRKPGYGHKRCYGRHTSMVVLSNVFPYRYSRADKKTNWNY